ncbi:MAG: hypothetical protein ACK5B6_10085 [Bacteroidia bacterium]
MLRKIIQTISLLVVGLYFIAGLSLLLTDFNQHLISGSLRTMSGILCLVYGTYRVARLRSKMQSDREEQ